MSLITNKLRMATIPPKYGEPPHWITTVPTVSISGAVVDSFDNTISVGLSGSYGAGSNDLIVIKQDTNGDIVWARSLGGTDSDSGIGIDLDSSDNIIVCGRTSGTTSSDRAFLAKYDSSGNLQWSRAVGSGLGTEYFNSVSVDNLDNIVGAGVIQGIGGAGQNGFIAKYTSDGNLSWARTLSTSSNEEIYAVDIDSSRNIYIGGSSGGLGTNYQFFVAKYDTNGNYSWGRKTQYGICEGVKVDRSDNILAVGREYYDGATRLNTFLLKYSSSGTLLSKLRFGNSSDSERAVSVTIDRSDNLVLVGTLERPTPQKIYVTKRTSTGSQIWSRTLANANSIFNTTGSTVALDSTDNIIIAGSVLAKLHPDGTGTGTYGGYIYATANTENVTGTFGASASITEFTSASSASIANTVPTVTSNSATIPYTIISL